MNQTGTSAAIYWWRHIELQQLQVSKDLTLVSLSYSRLPAKQSVSISAVVRNTKPEAQNPSPNPWNPKPGLRRGETKPSWIGIEIRSQEFFCVLENFQNIFFFVKVSELWVECLGQYYNGSRFENVEDPRCQRASFEEFRHWIVILSIFLKELKFSLEIVRM